MRVRFFALLVAISPACAPAPAPVVAPAAAPAASTAPATPEPAPEAPTPPPEVPTLPAGVDVHGAALPEGAVARFGSDRFRVASTSASIAFDGSGRALVLDHVDGRDIVREIVTGKVLLSRPTRRIGALAADGAAIVDGDLHVVELAGEKERTRLVLPKTATIGRGGKRFETTPSVHRIVASANAEIVVVETFGAAFVFDGRSGALKHTLTPTAAKGTPAPRASFFQPSLSIIALSRNGATLLTEDHPGANGLAALFSAGPATTPTARAWDLATGRAITQPAAKANARERWLSVSAEGTSAIVARDSRTILLDLKTGKETAELEESVVHASRAEMSADGRWALVARGRTMRLVDQTGKERRRFERTAHDLALSRDGKGVLARSGRGLLVGDAVDGLDEGPPTHDARVQDGALSPDGQLLATVATDGLRLWDARIGKPLGHAPLANAKLTAISAAGDKLLVATGMKVLSIGLLERRAARELLKAPNDVTALAFGHGAVAAIAWSGGAADRVSLVDTDAGTRVALQVPQSFPAEPGRDWVTGLSFSRDGARLAVAAGAIYVFSTTDRELLQTIRVAGDPHITSVSFVDDDRLVVAGDKPSVVRTSSGEVRDAWGLTCERMAASPSGGLVACTSGSLLSVVDAADGKPRLTHKLPSASTASPRFTTDGRRVLTFHDDGTSVAWAVP